MGADRKGPLAALIVVTLIAVILLVTAVRSQAATGRPIPSQASSATVARTDSSAASATT